MFYRQILAEQDFSPWSKYAEETEIWGPRALAAEAHKPVPCEKPESDSGGVPRGRAISCVASSVPGPFQRKFQRQFSVMAKLSSSAPHQQGTLGAVGPTNLTGSDKEFRAGGEVLIDCLAFKARRLIVTSVCTIASKFLCPFHDAHRALWEFLLLCYI